MNDFENDFEKLAIEALSPLGKYYVELMGGLKIKTVEVIEFTGKGVYGLDRSTGQFKVTVEVRGESNENNEKSI